MITSLQSCNTRDDLAHLLGYKASSLSYILYQIHDTLKYTPFTIKKKDGSDRVIHAPVPKLKKLQKKLSNVLHECVAEIEKSNDRPYRSATGFRRGASIVENAKRHVGRRYVFNIDLEDFFPSIHIGRVKGFFLRDKFFCLKEEVALTIAQIACHEGRLPQGSPCSPIISNLVGSILDARLAKFSGKHGCRYTRYADDITFSTNKTEFPSSIAVEDKSDQGWVIADDLASRLNDAGFSAKSSKTRMSIRSSRQMVTGLVVNSKANVTEEFYRRTRAMCHRLFTGNEPYQHQFFDKNPSETKNKASLSHIEGRLAHIYWTRSKSDPRSLKEQQDSPTNHFAIYRDFLIYKTFYASAKPLVITEGESDRIYIKLASLSLFPKDADFAIVVDGRLTTAFRSFNYPKRMSQVVGLSGGTGNLVKTFVQLKDFSRRHGSISPIRPVIILVDNDAGGKSLFKPIKQIFGVTIPMENTRAFNKLIPGVYLVRTPSLQGLEETFIESFLPEGVLKQEVGGKTFNPNTTFDTANHFGKVRLAQIVARTAANVDFDEFSPLLERLRATWNSWSSDPIG